MDATTQYALAYALTTTAGIRGLLALAAVSLAAHFGFLHPPQGFAWLGSWQVSGVLTGVAALDFVADKVPLLDHALHALHVVVKPAAAAIIVGGVVHPHSDAQLLALMVAGALLALGVHAASATVRGASTVTTGGIGNPFVSLFEDAVSAVLIVAAFLAPYLAAAGALFITLSIVIIVLRVRGHRASAPATAR